MFIIDIRENYSKVEQSNRPVVVRRKISKKKKAKRRKTFRHFQLLRRRYFFFLLLFFSSAKTTIYPVRTKTSLSEGAAPWKTRDIFCKCDFLRTSKGFNVHLEPYYNCNLVCRVGHGVGSRVRDAQETIDVEPKKKKRNSTHTHSKLHQRVAVAQVLKSETARSNYYESRVFLLRIFCFLAKINYLSLGRI